jgi:hypothetical protein
VTARSFGTSICFLLAAVGFLYGSTTEQGLWIIPIEVIGGLALAGIAIWQAKLRQARSHL